MMPHEESVVSDQRFTYAVAYAMPTPEMLIRCFKAS